MSGSGGLNRYAAVAKALLKVAGGERGDRAVDAWNELKGVRDPTIVGLGEAAIRAIDRTAVRRSAGDDRPAAQWLLRYALHEASAPSAWLAAARSDHAELRGVLLPPSVAPRRRDLSERAATYLDALVDHVCTLMVAAVDRAPALDVQTLSAALTDLDALHRQTHDRLDTSQTSLAEILDLGRC